MNNGFILFFLIFLFSCNNSPKDVEISYEQLKEPLIKINKTNLEIENDQIEQYIQRRNWQMVKTGTGLRYRIYEQGNGTQAKEGMVAFIKFEVSLLNGTICYTNMSASPTFFLIGMDNIESGLHEAITYLKVGDKANIIIPSYLAYGLVGDLDKIPPKSTVVYHLELVDVKNKEKVFKN